MLKWIIVCIIILFPSALFSTVVLCRKNKGKKIPDVFNCVYIVFSLILVMVMFFLAIQNYASRIENVSPIKALVCDCVPTGQEIIINLEKSCITIPVKIGETVVASEKTFLEKIDYQYENQLLNTIVPVPSSEYRLHLSGEDYMLLFKEK